MSAAVVVLWLKQLSINHLNKRLKILAALCHPHSRKKWDEHFCDR